MSTCLTELNNKYLGARVALLVHGFDMLKRSVLKSLHRVHLFGMLEGLFIIVLLVPRQLELSKVPPAFNRTLVW